MDTVPPQHQRLIDQLIGRGFRAVFRQWGLGDTVQVLHDKIPGPDGVIQAYRIGAYLVPTDDGRWGVDIGIADDAPVAEADVVDRVVRLLCHDGEFEREFKRRARLLDRRHPPT